MPHGATRVDATHGHRPATKGGPDAACGLRVQPPPHAASSQWRTARPVAMNTATAGRSQSMKDAQRRGAVFKATTTLRILFNPGECSDDLVQGQG